jgi:hypothetical protein
MSAMGQSLPGRASSKSGHVRYAPKRKQAQSIGGRSDMPCRLIATLWTSFPCSSLLKGGPVPIRKH